jgi:hypothetical protein
MPRTHVGPETLTVRILGDLAAEYQRIDRREAARLRLLAAIVENCPNQPNLESAGRAIRLARGRLTRATQTCPPSSPSPTGARAGSP